MKVYELMDRLSTARAGAEVELSKIMSIKEFTDCEIVDNIDGQDNYKISGEVTDVYTDDDTVTLYID